MIHSTRSDQDSSEPTPVLLVKTRVYDYCEGTPIVLSRIYRSDKEYEPSTQRMEDYSNSLHR